MRSQKSPAEITPGPFPGDVFVVIIYLVPRLVARSRNCFSIRPVESLFEGKVRLVFSDFLTQNHFLLLLRKGLSGNAGMGLIFEIWRVEEHDKKNNWFFFLFSLSMPQYLITLHSWPNTDCFLLEVSRLNPLAASVIILLLLPPMVG
ncbi:hypothetical protein CEXT_582011 [Caerostris extrusa]|uniref:Uncharacterized protein n=1 Tax=Caerostris extrusa TaxID=172846 RepID=A0AAV4MDY6_CAEEX|nr:hypothetical protein CEXT_582011 [Caerostris extrusa]